MPSNHREKSNLEKSFVFGNGKEEGCPFQNPELPPETRVNDLISRLTIDEKLGLLPTRAQAVERLGIKAFNIGGEAAHGLIPYGGGATTFFPQPTGLACTWDMELMHEIGDVIGCEARVCYHRVGKIEGLCLWAPTIDMARDPRWGRTEETYGEDPYLAGKMSSALIKGMQGEDPFYLKVVATPKHFYGYNTEKNRICSSSSVGPRNKREYYLKVFQYALLEGGASSMMTGYNCINGTPVIMHPDILNIVKDEWKMKGFVVTDGMDISQTIGDHKYSGNFTETLASVLKSGVDCLNEPVDLVANSLKEALTKGLLTEADIDDALRNILRVRFRLGQFDLEGLNPYENIPESALNCEKHRGLTLKAARESIVLLKNEKGILPLNKDKINKIAVIGPLANVVYRDFYSGTYPYTITPLDGIQNKLKGKPVLFREGCDQITIKSCYNNKYISPENTEQGALRADKSQAGPTEIFDLTDWGWGSQTLRSHANGKYVVTTITNDIPEDIWARSKEVNASEAELRGWYLEGLFDFETVDASKDIYKIRAWNRTCLSAPSGRNNHLMTAEKYSVSDHYLHSDEEKFVKETVVNGIDEAAAAAKTADAAIVFLGNHPLINGKENLDRNDIVLPPSQEKLIQEVYQANPNTIVVIIGSYPFAVNWVNENIPAILYSAHGSQELGNAIADVLFGDYSPAGRLNMTWYSSAAHLPDMMDYDIIKGQRTYMYFDGKPLYPFGHGLSYTSFRYDELKLSSSTVDQEESVTIDVQVHNTGGVASDEVVQMYVHAKTSRVKRPIKELKGFQRIHLQPKETKKVSFILKAKEMAFWDVTRDKFCVESGEYEIMIGNSSENIQLTDVFTVEGGAIPPRDLTVITRAENYDDYHRASARAGIMLGECKESRTCVVCTDDGDWLRFDDVDFGSGVSYFEARASSDAPCSIEIRLDSPEGLLVGICKVDETGGRQSFATFRCSIDGAMGRRGLYLIFKGALKLSWFRFER